MVTKRPRACGTPAKAHVIFGFRVHADPMNARGTFTKVATLGCVAKAADADGAPLRRFVRWGLIRGPLWGVVAVAVGLPVAAVVDYSGSMSRLVLVALCAGVLGGPFLGAAAGIACTVADRAPKWFIDAPDYVAVLAVIGTMALIAWPLLGLGHYGFSLGAATVLSLGLAPAVDAAAHAPRLLHPRTSARTQRR